MDSANSPSSTPTPVLSSLINSAEGWILLTWLLCWLAIAEPLRGAATPQARHTPTQPRSGQAVRITVEPVPGVDVSDWQLEYQAVAPGNYVARDDPRYAKDWKTLALTRTPKGELEGEVPVDVQQNRRLVRYRVRSIKAGAVVLPPKDDTQGNWAYFVYDGVPAWRGAVNPKSNDAQAREVKTFGPEVFSRVPVYQLLARKDAVENVMWKGGGGSHLGDDSRSAYNYTGTIVYEGAVYDHVPFRARGGAWRHSMGKNMWRFNFSPGHRFAAKDDYGRPYAGKWDKLNLGACIQQGNYGLRGEQGLVESVSYRLFNLAGVEAPRTHWVHLRVVTETEETPADQYRGDFWGLYLATEEIDGDFLKEHRLPAGNIYKIEGFAPQPKHFADPVKSDPSDAGAFLGQVLRGGTRASPGGAENWWRRNVDLGRYYGYRAVLEAVHHYDIDAGKNYFFYHNFKAARWQVIPWDVDLTWGEHMYGGGNEPFFRPVLQAPGPFRGEYQERLAELMDLLLNPKQMSRLIDEHAAIIWNGPARLSLADADRAKWDYHPIMSSRYIMRGKSDPGLFYLRDPGNRFDVMLTLMKRFTLGRQRHMEALLTGYRPPSAPKLTGPKSVSLAAGMPRLTAVSPDGAARYRWRVAEVTDPKSGVFDARKPWRHEIETLWESGLGVSPEIELPITTLVAGHSYRVRVRSQSSDGRWSRWSDPVELVAQ